MTRQYSSQLEYRLTQGLNQPRGRKIVTRSISRARRQRDMSLHAHCSPAISHHNSESDTIAATHPMMRHVNNNSGMEATHVNKADREQVLWEELRAGQRLMQQQMERIAKAITRLTIADPGCPKELQKGHNDPKPTEGPNGCMLTPLGYAIAKERLTHKWDRCTKEQIDSLFEEHLAEIGRQDPYAITAITNAMSKAGLYGLKWYRLRAQFMLEAKNLTEAEREELERRMRFAQQQGYNRNSRRQYQPYMPRRGNNRYRGQPRVIQMPC